MKARAVVLSALLLVATACIRPAPATAGTDEDLVAVVEKWRVRAHVPAVVAMVAGPKVGTHAVAAGTLHRSGSRRVSIDSRFRAASITKMLVAVVALQLEAEGRLPLDDPVEKHLSRPPYRTMVEGVQVRDLLAHTSGIPDAGRSPELTAALVDQPNREWKTEDVVGLATGRDRDFAPGTAYGYSNTNYLLVGEVIERVTGRPWQSEVRERILNPAGMASSYFAGFEHPTGPLVPGYFDLDNDGDTEEVPEPWPALESSEGAAGALVSTGPDLMRFLSALAGGKLVPERVLTKMTRPGPFSSRYSGYGLGIEVRRPDLQTLVWGHGGFLPGSRAVAWHVPSRKLNIVVLANESRSRPDGLAELLLKRVAG